MYLNTQVLKVDKWAVMKLEIHKLPNLPQHLKLICNKNNFYTK